MHGQQAGPLSGPADHRARGRHQGARRRRAAVSRRDPRAPADGRGLGVRALPLLRFPAAVARARQGAWHSPYSLGQGAAVRDRRSVLVTRETGIKPGILPSGTTTPLPGAVIEPPPSLPVPVEAQVLPAARRRGVRWGIALAVSLAALISGVVVIDAALWISDLFERSAWLGGAGALLIGGVSVALVGFIGGEYRNLMRLRSAQAIREQGYHLAQASNRFEGRGFMSDLVRLTANSRAGRLLCEQYRDAIADTHDDREAME